MVPTSQQEAEVLNQKLVDIQYCHYVEKYDLDPDRSPKETMIELAKRLDEAKKGRSLNEGEHSERMLDTLHQSAVNRHFSQMNEMLRERMDEACTTSCICPVCEDMKRDGDYLKRSD